MRCLLVLACLGSVAAADSLRMERGDAETIHIANQGGAINTNNQLVITVDLQAKGKAAVKAMGSNNEHNLWVSPTGNRNTDDSTWWTTTWTGTWVITKGALSLDLTLEKHDCKAQRTEGESHEKLDTCKTASKTAKLTCVTQTISVDKDAKPHGVEAWACTPADKTELAESAGTWTFGKKKCLKQIGGHMTPFSWTDC